MELNEFKITVLPLRPKLLNYALKLTESPEDAEDVVQEVLLKLWNNRLKLNQYRSVEAFAMTLTHNVCMDQRRRSRDNSSIDQLQTVAGGGTPDHLLELKDEVKLIRTIIDSLPPLQRTVIRMKDVEEYESEEIAQITGCSAEAIRSNLSRARKKVRDIYLQTIQERKRRKQP